MFGSLARFALVFAGLAFVIPDTLAHDSWISAATTATPPANGVAAKAIAS